MDELNRVFKLIEESTEPVWICDAQHRVVFSNEAFNAMIERTSDEILGEMPSSFLAGERTSKAEVERIWHRTDEGTPFDFGLEAYRSSGEVFIFKSFAIPFVDGDSSVPYVVAICSEKSELDAPLMANVSPEFKKLIGDVLAMVQAS